MTLKRPARLSVVVPAYDEEQRIGATLVALREWLSTQPWTSEILVVDDGSTDRTREVVRGVAAARPAYSAPEIELVESRPNRGKGHAVRLGMLAAGGELRLFMDADHSTHVRALDRLLPHVAAGADVVIGSRRAPGAVLGRRQPLARDLWSRAANRVVQAGLLDGICDTQCGFKLFTGRAAEQVFRRVRTPGWGFDLEALVIARSLGLRIDEVPVEWSDDRRSRIRPLRDACRITGEFLRIRRAFRRGEYALPSGAGAALRGRHESC